MNNNDKCKTDKLAISNLGHKYVWEAIMKPKRVHFDCLFDKLNVQFRWKQYVLLTSFTFYKDLTSFKIILLKMIIYERMKRETFSCFSFVVIGFQYCNMLVFAFEQIFMQCQFSRYCLQEESRKLCFMQIDPSQRTNPSGWVIPGISNTSSQTLYISWPMTM